MRTTPSVLLVLAMSSAAATPLSSTVLEIDQDLAQGEFQLVLDAVEGASTHHAEANEVAQLQLLRAQALLGLGRTKEARAAFIQAIRTDAAVDLDVERASPDAVSLLEAVRADLPGTLEVVARADDADVAVDGITRGVPPLQMQLSPGVHVVEVTRRPGPVTRVEVRVPAGRKLVFDLDTDAPVLEVRTLEPWVSAQPPVVSAPTPLTHRWYFWAGASVVATGLTVAAVALAASFSSPRSHGPVDVCRGACDACIGEACTGVRF